MYSIVLEKEDKLIEMMKMNGLSMTNYWSVIILKLGILPIFFLNVLCCYVDFPFNWIFRSKIVFFHIN